MRPKSSPGAQVEPRRPQEAKIEPRKRQEAKIDTPDIAAGVKLCINGMKQILNHKLKMPEGTVAWLGGVVHQS